jgi:SAM-dependent methyltransferase
MSEIVETGRQPKSFINENEAVYFNLQSDRVKRNCQLLQSIARKDCVAYLGCSSTAADLYLKQGVGTLHAYDVSRTHGDNLRQDTSIETAGRKYLETFWDVDGGDCPAPDNTYDVIIAGEVVEHLFNTDKFARELYRTLKPAGTLIISTPNLASWYNRLRLLRGKAPRSFPGTSATLKKDEYIDTAHIRVNILSEWTYFLKEHGFEVTGVYGGSYFHALQGGLKTRLIKAIDRVASKTPEFAVYLTLVAHKA